MAAAYIDGQPAALPEAIGEAARLLGNACYPVIAGLGTDIAGARAAIRLAERLRCPFDHFASEAVLASLSVMRDAGWMVISPQEARRLADVVLLAGRFEEREWPIVRERLGPATARLRVVSLGTAASARRLRSAGYRVDALSADQDELPAVLAALRARVAGRPVGGSRARKIDPLAELLVGAKFGVALWAGSMDRLAVEMLAGLVKDLNVGTRFSSFMLAAPGNGTGVAQAAGWLAGFPVRTSFARGYAEHDPWRFDARRLVDSQEADCALWISSYAAEAPSWQRRIPMIALTARSTDLGGSGPDVLVEVGVPGIDHDAVEWSAATGALAYVAATASSDRPRACDIIGRIAAALPEPPT